MELKKFVKGVLDRIYKTMRKELTEYNEEVLLYTYCLDATKYILENKIISELDCKKRYGKHLGMCVVKELKARDVGDWAGYGDITKTKDTEIYVNIFSELIEEKMLTVNANKEVYSYYKTTRYVAVISIIISVFALVVSIIT